MVSILHVVTNTTSIFNPTLIKSSPIHVFSPVIVPLFV
jgi:hypothetical protein